MKNKKTRLGLSSSNLISKELKQYCERRGIRLTALRAQILSIVAKQHQPITAYQVLDMLKKDNPKAQVMSVYRVLDFLMANHLIHRIESLNAYMGCCHLREEHLSQWLICESCGDAQEYPLPIFNQEVKKLEASTGFSVNGSMIELKGLCQNCQMQHAK